MLGSDYLPGPDVVPAAGVGTRALAATVGVDLPVEPSPSPLFEFARRRPWYAQSRPPGTQNDETT